MMMMVVMMMMMILTTHECVVCYCECSHAIAITVTK